MTPVALDIGALLDFPSKGPLLDDTEGGVGRGGDDLGEGCEGEEDGQGGEKVEPHCRGSSGGSERVGGRRSGLFEKGGWEDEGRGG